MLRLVERALVDYVIRRPPFVSSAEAVDSTLDAMPKPSAMNLLCVGLVVAAIWMASRAALETAEWLSKNNEYNSCASVRTALVSYLREQPAPVSLSGACPNDPSIDVTWRMLLIPQLEKSLSDDDPNRERLSRTYRIACSPNGKSIDHGSFYYGNVILLAMTYDGRSFAPAGLEGYEAKRDNPVIAVAMPAGIVDWSSRTDLLFDPVSDQTFLIDAQMNRTEVDVGGRYAIRQNGAVELIAIAANQRLGEFFRHSLDQ